MFSNKTNRAWSVDAFPGKHDWHTGGHILIFVDMREHILKKKHSSSERSRAKTRERENVKIFEETWIFHSIKSYDFCKFEYEKCFAFSPSFYIFPFPQRFSLRPSFLPSSVLSLPFHLLFLSFFSLVYSSTLSASLPISLLEEIPRRYWSFFLDHVADWF